MTWNEFKTDVDQQLTEMGYDGSLEMEYIDICRSSFYRKDINVSINNFNQLELSIF